MHNSLFPSGLRIDRKFLIAVLSLALPVAAQLLLQSLLGMADVTMVAVLGAAPLAAVGLAAKIQFLLLVYMSGIATACSVLVAQYRGAQQTKRYQQTLGMAMVLGVCLAIPLVLLFLFGAERLMAWLTPDLEVSRIAAQYLCITAPTLVLIQIIVIYEASLRALGSTRLSLLASLVSVLMNILLNYVLIFGYWGFPELGVAGAAWGTLVARACQLVFIVGFLYPKKHELALAPRRYIEACEWAQFKRFMIFSLPLVANYLFWGIGNTTYHVLTGFAGTSALAVMGVMVPLEMCFFAFFVGLASASSVMIGHALGAGDPARARALFTVFDRFAITLVILMCLLVWFSREAILGLYGNLDPTTEALLKDVLTVFCLTVWLRVLNLMRIVGALRAGGDTQFCLGVDMLVMWGLGLPLYAAAIFWGSFSFVWIYALIFVEDAAKIIPVHLRLRSGRWLKNLVQDNEHTPVLR